MTVERKAAGVPEHVRVRLEDQLGHLSSSLDHSREASSRKGRAALRGEHEWRFGILLTGQATQCPELVAADGMGAG